MKNYIYLFTILFALQSKSQTVQSSCNADTSITNLYQTDAKRLAVRKFYKQNLSFKDSVNIPVSHSDSVLKALVAVHNAVGLVARDTVVDIFNIHTFLDPYLKDIYIKADTSEFWMMQLKNNVIPTGYSLVDDIIDNYNLTKVYYFQFSQNPAIAEVKFKSNELLNMKALSEYVQNIPQIISTSYGLIGGDGPDITDSIFTDRIQLTYSYGWGDCPVGCPFRRYWKFNVYNDCSVEYLGSYGSTIDFYVGLDELSNSANFLYPNPAQDFLQIEPDFLKDAVSINCNSSSGKIINLDIDNSGQIDISHLNSGMYFFELRNKDGVIYQKVVVE